jgi:crotonobetainyl-CoA:carnitine CoA-transferase CaiB-like acyl-CoA transferase
MAMVFEDIKVLDFTWAGVGPITTKYLADYGATVVRIESSSHPCILRTSPPYKDGVPGLNRSGYFAIYSPNKYSISINMRHPRRMEIIERLILWADVVAESFAPGVMERWGLGYDDIKRIKPEIIMFRTSMQGATGPHSHLRGTGVNLVGLSGFAHLCGWPDRTPSQPYGPYTDSIAPRFGAAMLIAALDYRRRTGKGQLIDLSQFEAGVSFLAPLIIDYLLTGRNANRMGNRDPFASPNNCYRCLGEDRWCAISVLLDDQWKGLCRAMGNPEWTEEERFSTLEGRKENEAELDRLIEGWTIQHTPEEVMAILQENGVPAGIVADAKDLHEDPQLKHRGHFWPMEQRNLGIFSYLGQPSRLSRTPAKPGLPSPDLGEHNEYVCREILKMKDDEFQELIMSGLFE